MAEEEGSWAREYRQGRAEQVEQQRIANLIALSASPLIDMAARKSAARQAARLLGIDRVSGRPIPPVEANGDR